MPSPFDALTLKQAQAALESRKPTDADIEARDLYEGNHWREGAGWIGQKPPEGSPEYDRLIAAIRNAFVSENVEREVVQRHRAGILGREPRWGFVPRRDLADGEEPSEDEQARAGEAEAALTTWWDRRKLLETLQGALVTALLMRRAPLRLFVPSGLRDERGQIAAPTLAAALDAIHLDAPDPAAAGVFVDDATRREVGIYAYKRYEPEGGITFIGVPQSGTGTDVAEVSYVSLAGETPDPEGRDPTALRVIGEGGVLEEAAPPLALGGRILMHELTREALVTDQIRQLQKALNLDLTQMLRNVNLAGSLERVLINLMPPGQYVDEAGNPWVEGKSTGTKAFKASPMPTGAGISAFLRGLEIRDKEGNLTGYSPGTVNYRDPVPVGTFVETRDTIYGSMLNQCDQRHALISGDAVASGKSREQARAEFETSLGMSKTAVDEAGRWVLETAAALAAIFMGQPGRYDDLRCEFGAIVDAGPLSPEDRQQIVAEYEADLISPETTLSRLDVDDVDAEIARVEAARERRDATMVAAVAGRPPGRPGTGQDDPGNALRDDLGQGGAA